MSMTEAERHERFKIAQDNAYYYGTVYDSSRSPSDRELYKDLAQTWAMIANALRRDHV